MTRLRYGIVAAALALSACHRAAEDPTAVTADEQRDLNDAASALDANGAAADDPDNGATSDRKEDRP